MKFKFSLKNKEASFEGDVERLIEKNIDNRKKKIENKVPKKTRYQIKQEEKRKNKELEFKQNMKMLLFGGIAFALIIAFCVIMSFVEKM